MKRLGVLLFGTVIAMIATSPMAAQAEPEPGGVIGKDVAEDGSTIILGGQTQDTDPTRYDYVAPPTGGITPMSASGIGTVPGFTFGWKGLTITVPGGTIYHSISGSGLTVTKETANFVFKLPNYVQLCNTQWQFQNRHGSTIYSTYTSPLRTGCTYGYIPDHTYSTKRNVKTGQLCARMYVAGTYRGEQCHNVYP